MTSKVQVVQLVSILLLKTLRETSWNYRQSRLCCTLRAL